jgi:hypothetical protein
MPPFLPGRAVNQRQKNVNVSNEMSSLQLPQGAWN